MDPHKTPNPMRRAVGENNRMSAVSEEGDDDIENEEPENKLKSQTMLSDQTISIEKKINNEEVNVLKNSEPDNGENGENVKSSIDSKAPDNIIYLLFPSWKARIKKINRSINHLKFIKKINTPSWLQPFADLLDVQFEFTKRGSTFGTEVTTGLMDFFSCMFILAVIPNQMATVGYSGNNSAAAISFMSGIGSIASAFITNLPIIVAPSTAISIYFISILQQSALTPNHGNIAVIFSGFIFFLVGLIGPLGRFISKVIPEYIQIGLNVGVGLKTALFGAIALNLVVSGKYSLLALGPLSSEVLVGMSSLVIIAVAKAADSKISYFLGLLWGSIIWWSVNGLWPSFWWAKVPDLSVYSLHTDNSSDVILLVLELALLDLLTTFGLAKALCSKASLLTEDGSIPRGRLLQMTVGIMNVISGGFSGPPIVLSESSLSGITAGAKTGLSAVVCGCAFLLSSFFGPLFSAIPSAGSSPVLIYSGLFLFRNIKSLDFDSKYALPTFLCLIFIPFADSIIAGLGFGVATYAIISILTGEFVSDSKDLYNYYFKGWNWSTMSYESEEYSDEGGFDGI
eukprot:gene15949-21642_t